MAPSAPATATAPSTTTATATTADATPAAPAATATAARISARRARRKEDAGGRHRAHRINCQKRAGRQYASHSLPNASFLDRHLVLSYFVSPKRNHSSGVMAPKSGRRRSCKKALESSLVLRRSQSVSLPECSQLRDRKPHARTIWQISENRQAKRRHFVSRSFRNAV
jgi:hypothetical protein